VWRGENFMRVADRLRCQRSRSSSAAALFLIPNHHLESVAREGRMNWIDEAGLDSGCGKGVLALMASGRQPGHR